MKCLINSCNNHQHQGAFIGCVCVPCAAYACAVKYNKEHIGQWHFTKGVMPDIRNQINEVFLELESTPNSPHNKHLERLKEVYVD